MKTSLYYGQPKSLPKGSAAPPRHEHGKVQPIGNIADFEEWLLREKPKPAGPNPTIKFPAGLRCVCHNPGEDGLIACSAMPHEHRLRLPSRTDLTVACDNHLKNYLNNGWLEVGRMVCSRCTVNAPMPNDGICEKCALELGELGVPQNDAIRLKRVGYCINRDTVNGCGIYSAIDDNLCPYCKNYMKLSREAGEKALSYNPSTERNPRVRSIPSSVRPCYITVGCAGNMTATIRRYSSTLPTELWWVCAVCKAQRVALKTTTIPASEGQDSGDGDALQVMLNEGGSDVDDADDPTGVAGMVRNMLAENE